MLALLAIMTLLMRMLMFAVLTFFANTQTGALNTFPEALAVLFEAVRPLAVAPLLVPWVLTVIPDRGADDLGLEGERVALHDRLARLLDLLLVRLDVAAREAGVGVKAVVHADW